MNTGTSSKRQHFDNLSYISDGRDRISYTNDPYAMPSRDTRAIALQPTELNRSRNEKNITYSYRPGQEGIYAYNNAAFSDISGADGPSIRSQHSNLYALQKSFGKPKDSGKVHRICAKYWYIFVLLTLIILVALGLGIGLGIFYSRDRSNECHLSCQQGERIVQINATYCECQFINECEFEPSICGQYPCIKFNGTGYECQCTTGFRHPPTDHDLKRCEDINECENPDACGANQICTNTDGNYTCSCQSGYEMNVTTNGIVCQGKYPISSPNKCHPVYVEFIEGLPSRINYKNECNGTDYCTNGRCVNTNGSFICVCNPGFQQDVFNRFHCEDIDECLTYNCTGVHEICVNTIGSFQCICMSGYRRDSNGDCLNINECAESSTACDVNSRCEDRNGSYACCLSSITSECIECGYDYTNGSSIVVNHVRRTRMIDGQTVTIGHFPWIAALLIKRDYYDSEPRYVCSASLVSSWNIITAAHCLDEVHFHKQWDLTNTPSSFKDIFDIRIGVHNLSLNSTEFLQSQSYSIENFTLHKDYQSLSSDNVLVQHDIALIRLSRRIERSSNLDWICLPTLVNVYDQNLLKVVSYSHTDDHSIQQQLDVRVLENQQTRTECQRQLNNIAEDAFCTISTRNSSSLGVGDSGAGGMIFSNNNRWQLAGVMSKTGVQKAYSAMTNISMHIEWLQSLVER